ncbi:MAG: flagellar filament capping protein FliD [bacterium]
MAIISGTGIFSGIDSAKIIDQLMAVERKPLETLQNKKSDYKIKVSNWGNISNLLNSLKSSLTNLKKINLVTYSAQSSNSNILTATASSNAMEGSYNIKVNSLASAQSIYSGRYNSIDDPIADLGSNPIQRLSIKVGNSEEKIITVDSSNNTLSAVRDAINNSGLKVKANIINDGNGYRLVINSTETGSANKIVIKVDEDNDGNFESSPEETDTIGLSSLAFNPVYDGDGNISGGVANLVQAKKALNATLEIDGVSVTRTKNEISDLITGVTIKLQNVLDNQTVTLNVSKDYSTASKNLNSFVSAYNTLMNALKDEKFKDDTISRQMSGSLRGILINSYDGKTLTNYGLNHDKTGVLNLETSKMEDALKNSFETITNTIDAMAKSLESNVNIYLDKIIPERKNTYNRQIEDIDKRVQLIEKRLEKVEFDYRKKFFELEKTVGNLQRSGDYVTQTFSKWGNTK